MKKRFLTIGSANICLNLNIKTLPVVNQEIIENNHNNSRSNYSFCLGGKGLICAATLAKYGIDSLLCSRIGVDDFSRKMLRSAQNLGIDMRFVFPERTQKTGFEIRISDSDNSKRVISFTGANAFLEQENIDEAFISYPDCLLLHDDLPEAIILDAAELSHKKDIPIVFQPARAREKFALEKLYPLEILILDEDEVFKYTSIEPKNNENCLSACIALSYIIKSKYYIIRLKGRYTYIYDGKYYKIIPEFPSSYIDTEASDIIFGACLALEYIQSHNMTDAVTFANIVYAISSSKQGGISSIPSMEEIQEYIKVNEIKKDS